MGAEPIRPAKEVLVKIRHDQLPKSIQGKHNATNSKCYISNEGTRIMVVEPLHKKFIYVFMVGKGWKRK